jgi:hypothetical protein
VLTCTVYSKFTTPSARTAAECEPIAAVQRGVQECSVQQMLHRAAWRAACSQCCTVLPRPPAPQPECEARALWHATDGPPVTAGSLRHVSAAHFLYSAAV